MEAAVGEPAAAVGPVDVVGAVVPADGGRCAGALTGDLAGASPPAALAVPLGPSCAVIFDDEDGAAVLVLPPSTPVVVLVFSPSAAF